MTKITINRYLLFVVIAFIAFRVYPAVDTAQLFKAIMQGKIVVVRQYLKQGADPNATYQGYQPLHLAAARGHNNIVKLLLKNGANIEAKSVMGVTPLQYAAVFGRTETIRLLLEKGADIGFRHPKGGTVLHVAVSQGHIDSIRLLLDKGVAVNDNINATRETALHAAVKKNYLVVAELLIAKGAKINMQDIYGWTPLDIAERYRLTKMIQLLRKHGAREAFADINNDKFRAERIIPARAVHRLLKSIKQNNLGLFKKSFSKNISFVNASYGWKKTFQSYRKIYAQLYGNYRLSDFHYLFRGNEHKGVVFVEYRGRKTEKFRVIKEDGAWRVNVR